MLSLAAELTSFEEFWAKFDRYELEFVFELLREATGGDALDAGVIKPLLADTLLTSWLPFKFELKFIRFPLITGLQMLLQFCNGI